MTLDPSVKSTPDIGLATAVASVDLVKVAVSHLTCSCPTRALPDAGRAGMTKTVCGSQRLDQAARQAVSALAGGLAVRREAVGS